MNKIKSYNNFINEGVRDQMTPKSDKELLKYIKKLNKDRKTKLLYDSVMKKDLETARFLLDTGADIEVVDCIPYAHSHMMSFHKEIRELVDEYRNKKPINKLKKFFHFNESVKDQMTPKSEEHLRNMVKDFTPDQELTIACQRGILWLAKEAIEKGANYNTWTFISDACRYNQLEIVKYLVDEMDVNPSIKNETPLKNSVINGNTDIAEYLIDKGADVNYEKGLFYVAWDCMHADMCRLLVKRGFDLQSFISSKPLPIELKYFIEHHFPEIDVKDFKVRRKEIDHEIFMREAITWDFNKPTDEQRYKKHLDKIMNAKVGDIVDNDDIYQYVEYLTIQAGKYEYSFVDGDLAERIEEYSQYVLKELLLDAIDLDEWDVDRDTANEYRLQYLKGKEYPPIVVDAQYSIIDGIHRANGLKRAGLTKILSFVGIEN